MVTVRKYFLEAFLTAAGAAAAVAVAVPAGSVVWGVIGTLLGGVAIACFAASLRPAPAVAVGPKPKKPRPRVLGARARYGAVPETTVAPPPRKAA